MSKKAPKTRYRSDGKALRFPETYEGLQANSCRNAGFPGFGIEALSWVKPGRPVAGEEGVRDNYRLTNRSVKASDGKLQCQICGSRTAIKSNQAIREELGRISAYLTPPGEPSCPSDDCECHDLGVFSHPYHYTCKGTFPTSKRMKCRACGTLFYVATSSLKVVGHFESSRWRFLYGPRFFGAGSFASTIATRSATSQRRSVRPASIAGVTLSVWWTFDEIQNQHRRDVELSVFPATPVSCSVEFGRVWQPKGQPSFDVYDMIHGEGFVQRLRIGA